MEEVMKEEGKNILNSKPVLKATKVEKKEKEIVAVPKPVEEETVETPLVNILTNGKVLSTLKREGIVLLSQLPETKEEMIEIKGIGKSSAASILADLKRNRIVLINKVLKKKGVK
jgi:hypothetical protein